MVGYNPLILLFLFFKFLQFYTDLVETFHVLSSWSETVYVDFIQSSGYILVKLCKASAFYGLKMCVWVLYNYQIYILLLFRGCELRHFSALIAISV